MMPPDLQGHSLTIAIAPLSRLRAGPGRMSNVFRGLGGDQPPEVAADPQPTRQELLNSTVVVYPQVGTLSACFSCPTGKNSSKNCFGLCSSAPHSTLQKVGADGLGQR